MMTVPEVTFTADGGGLPRDLPARIEERFRTRRGRRSRSRRTYYDTFDWRLFRNGGVLCAERRSGRWLLRWQRLDGSTTHHCSADRPPDFAWDPAAAPFGDALARIIDVRRLLPVAHVDARSETLAILDSREKTVARVFLERGTAAADGDASSARPMAERLRAVPVLGYGDDHAALVRHLDGQSDLQRHEGGELALALEVLGVRAGDYSSKLDVALDPRMRADEAAREILRALLKTMRANEDGTRRDLDSEFLHDFRVAVRRTRSCLGQVKAVFDEASTERFRKEFAWLGGVTGPTRDLDVYLLGMREYRLGLPDSLRGDLDPLEHHLRKRQRQEQRRVARALDSRRYRDLVRDWSQFLDDTAPAEQAGAPNASRPVREVAAERTRRAFRRVRKRGRGLERDSPPEAFHRLRIDCKKLRYLLEFFRSVFGPGGTAPFVRSLKRLQNHLGEFNDLDVQQRELRAMAAEMLEAGAAGADTLLAMGCLIERLRQRQVALQEGMVAAVRAFAGADNRERLRELLRSEGSG